MKIIFLLLISISFSFAYLEPIFILPVSASDPFNLFFSVVATFATPVLFFKYLFVLIRLFRNFRNKK